MTNILSRGEQGSEGSRSPASREWGPGNLFGDFFGMDPLRGLSSVLAPLSGFGGVEIRRSEDGYQAEIPVPGLRADQIEVTYQGNVLTISGNGDRRRLWRSIVLPEEIDPQSVTAQVEHGLLTLVMRLPPEAQPRRIQVTTGRFPKQETDGAEGGAQFQQSSQQPSEATSGSGRGNRN